MNLLTTFRFHGLARTVRSSCSLTLYNRLCSTVNEPKPKLPTRIKNKIGNYFRELFGDYRMAAQDAVEDARSVPRKTVAWLGALGGTAYLAYTRPDLGDLRCCLSEAGTDLSFVHVDLRSPISEAHVHALSRWNNEGRLRALSLLLLTVVWLDDVDRSCDEYAASCRYDKPRWREIPKRIVDVGVAGRWLYLRRALLEYDVNENEWPQDAAAKEAQFYK